MMKDFFKKLPKIWTFSWSNYSFNKKTYLDTTFPFEFAKFKYKIKQIFLINDKLITTLIASMQKLQPGTIHFK